MSPTLSIITVCRNERERITRTAESVVAQTFTDFEWIVIDGGSTDGTLDKFVPYANRITHLISEPDNGIFDAMNKGIRFATGNYLLFLCGGDWLIDENALSDIFATRPECDIVTGGIYILYPDGRTQLRPGNDLPVDRNRLYWRTLPHCSSFIRRSLFEQCGDYDLSFPIAADWEFFMKVILRHGASVRQIARPVAIFTNDGNSAVPQNRKRHHRERIRLRRRYFSLPYRLRREANEAWGRMTTTVRHLIKPAPGHQSP